MPVPVVREARVNAPTANAELLMLRQAIDGLDEALGALLVSRVCLSHQAQALKARAETSVPRASQLAPSSVNLSFVASVSPSSSATERTVMFPHRCALPFRGIVFVTTTLLISWLLSLTMTPLLCINVLHQRRPRCVEDSAAGRHPAYRWLLERLLRWRRSTLAATVIVFVAAVWTLEKIPFIFFPPREGRIFTAEFTLPPGAPIERTERVLVDIERFLQSELHVSEGRPEGLTGWATFIGRSAPRFVLTHAPIVSTPEHAMMLCCTTSQDVISSAMERLERFCFDEFPDLEVSIKRVRNGPPVRWPIEMKISGPSLEVLDRIAETFKIWLRRHPGTKTVQDDWGRRSKKLVIDVDQPRARRAGVTSRDIAVALQAGLAGIETTQFREGNQVIPVLLRAEQAERQSVEDLDGVNVASREPGRSVPLRQVADARVVFQAANIKRLNRKRTIAATADLHPGTTAAEVSGAFREWVEQERGTWPYGYEFTLGGEMAESGKANYSILEQLPLAGALILLLLILQFNSLRHTFIILMTIPMGLVGVTVGLHVLRSYFGFMTLLGVVSLSGIVVNNAIVLLDRIRIEREAHGLDGYDAVIVSAQRRLRPILLTTATTIGGLVPLYTSGGAMWQPMAIAIMFGLGFSTVLTLGVVPVLYAALYDVRPPS